MNRLLHVAVLCLFASLSPRLSATPINGAFTCDGSCGSEGANGSVSAPPGGGTYQYLSTSGGENGVGEIAKDGGTDGSTLTTNSFTLAQGQTLSMYFDYVTTDTGYSSQYFPDYSWAALMSSANQLVGYLFTAQSWDDGPRLDQAVTSSTIASLVQSTGGSAGSAPQWNALGSSSGSCWGDGCGYSGWTQASYTDTSAGSGTYYIQFGITNVGDRLYDSGLAVANIAVTGAQSGGTSVPEPWTAALLASGLLVSLFLRRRPAT